jgi:hypothetical protein
VQSVIREILSGDGMTKPGFTGSSNLPARVNLDDTPLVWEPLLALYHARHGVCGCGCKEAVTGKQRYASPACRQRVSRLRDRPRPSTQSA